MTEGLIWPFFDISFRCDYIEFLQDNCMKLNSWNYSEQNSEEFQAFIYSQEIQAYYTKMRIHIRKDMKGNLSSEDKTRFTKMYEFVYGKSYRDSFEKKVNIQLNRFLYWKYQENCLCNSLFSQIQSECLPIAPYTLPKI